jgi:hypothetical protein
LVVKVQTTGNISPGKTFVKNHFRTIEYLAAAATSPAVLTSAQNAKWGAPTVGSAIWVKASVIQLSSGLESGFLTAKAIVS